MAELYRRERSPYWFAILSDPRCPRGIRRLSTKQRSEREARKTAAALQDAIDAEIASAPKGDGLLWTEAVLLHQELAELKDTTRRGNAPMAALIARELGDFNLNSLTHDQLRRFCQERRKQTVAPPGAKDTGRRVSDVTIRRQLSYISSVYATLIDHDIERGPATNPVKTFDRSFLKTSQIVDRHLRVNQFQEAMACLKQTHHQAMLVMLVATGLRDSELSLLTWDEVDFECNVIEFGNVNSQVTKTSRSRRLPLLKPVAEVLRTHKLTLLKRQRYDPKGPVFPNLQARAGEIVAMEDFAYVRKKVQRETGMKRFTIHGLRHTFASWALQQGIDAEAIRKALGHATKSTTDRYAHHIDDSELAQLRMLDLRLNAHFVAHTSASHIPMDIAEEKNVETTST